MELFYFFIICYAAVFFNMVRGRNYLDTIKSQAISVVEITLVELLLNGH